MFIRLEYQTENKNILWGVKEILQSDFSQKELEEKSISVRDNFKNSEVHLINKISIELPLFEDFEFWDQFKQDVLPTLSKAKVIKNLHVSHNPKIMNRKTIEIFVRQIAKLFGYLLGSPVGILNVDLVSYIDLKVENKKTQPIWDFRDHEFVCVLEQSAWNCEYGGKHDLIFTTLKSMSSNLEPIDQNDDIRPKINRTINIAETLRKNREAASKVK